MTVVPVSFAHLNVGDPCPGCGAPTKALFTGLYCSNECDLPADKRRVIAPSVLPYEVILRGRIIWSFNGSSKAWWHALVSYDVYYRRNSLDPPTMWSGGFSDDLVGNKYDITIGGPDGIAIPVVLRTGTICMKIGGRGYVQMLVGPNPAAANTVETFRIYHGPA